ncbi:MAG: MFS transporter, partial [Bacteroidetes bacterium]|nr:MFS transporter [Bacteroidota bacterium]
SGVIVDKYKLAEGHDWKSIWMVPAYIAIGVLIYFILFFREKRQIQQAA